MFRPKFLFPILVILFFGYALSLVGLRNISLLFSVKNPTPVSPLYYVKITRENFQSFFVFGPIDQAGWHLTLAEKRIQEAQILKEHFATTLFKHQIKLAKDEQQKAEIIISELKGKTDTQYLETTYNRNQQAIKILEELEM